MKTLHNNKLQWILIIVLINLTLNSNANDLENDNSIATHKKTDSCEQLVIAEVNGLVCDFCARALEKVFNKKPEVSAIDVNLDEGQVEIQFKYQQRIDDESLKKLINDSGYNLTQLKSGCEL